MKTDKFTEVELKAAYDMCILVKSHSDNVIASGEDSPTDREWSRKATKFVEAYERVNAYKLAKSGKAGQMGDALLKVQQIIKTISEIKP